MAKKDKGLLTGDPITYQTPNPAGGVQMETFIPWTLVKRGVKRQVITPIDTPEQFQMEATVERQERGSPGHAADTRIGAGAPLAVAARRWQGANHRRYRPDGRRRRHAGAAVAASCTARPDLG